MKKLFCLLLIPVLLLGLAACGKKEAAKPPVDLQPVYDSLVPKMPEMMPLDDTLVMNFFGIDPADCEQVITAICADSMSADEIWLIRAKDTAALEKIQKLAENRLTAKAEECESYAPDQYAIVKKAELMTKDLYLCLLVGPEAAEMKAAVEKALG